MIKNNKEENKQLNNGSYLPRRGSPHASGSAWKPPDAGKSEECRPNGSTLRGHEPREPLDGVPSGILPFRDSMSEEIFDRVAVHTFSRPVAQDYMRMLIEKRLD